VTGAVNVQVLVTLHICLTDDTHELIRVTAVCIVVSMPGGKHTGVRTMLTLPKEVDDHYVRMAKAMNVPKASLLREILTSAVPYTVHATKSLNELRERPEQSEAILARLLWDSLKDLHRD